jgi:stearoyl-CoA desaturase (Delta-9 desaturase)
MRALAQSRGVLNATSNALTIITIVLPFLGVLAAARLTWSHGVGGAELTSFAIMYVLTFVGVEVGFHRHFAHRSFLAARPVRILLAGLGSMAWQGSVVWWAGVHRIHHANADRSGDPHSPLEGLLHAHVGWLFKNLDPPGWRRRAANLFRDDVVRMATRSYYLWALAGILLPAVGVAIATRSAEGLLLGFLWGGLVRIFFVNHFIWSINSVCHRFGSRPYQLRDESRNNALLCLPSLGFSWHNNHHAFPGSAINSHHWWQLDICGLLILGLQRLGLAWNARNVSGLEKDGEGVSGIDGVPSRGMLAKPISRSRPAGVRVLIITPAGEAVEKARALGSEMLGLSRADLMKTPLSPTGKPPATHWVCKNYFPKEIVHKIASYPLRHGTEIIIGEEFVTSQVLVSRGLKRIVVDGGRGSLGESIHEREQRLVTKSILGELPRIPEFIRWRNPLLLLLLVMREIFHPLMYWYIFDIFERDLRRPMPESYAKDSLDVMIYEGNKDLKQAVEELTSFDDLLPAEIELRFRRGDVVAVAYAAGQVVGCTWLTFVSGMELTFGKKAFGTNWIIDPTEAIRYGSFVHPHWRGRAIHSLLNSAINRYARDRGLLRTLAGISVLNSQSSSLPKHLRNLRVMRVFLLHVRGVKWTYRKALGAPLESRFAIVPSLPARRARPQFLDGRRLSNIMNSVAHFVSLQIYRRRQTGRGL